NLAIALALAGVLLGPATGRAQPVASSIDPKTVEPPSKPPADDAPAPAPAPADEPTAVDVQDAPVPGKESGRIAGGESRDSTPRVIGRGLLFLPRVLVAVAFAPIRGGLWVDQRYRIVGRIHDFLFSGSGNMGVLPTISLESEYGVNVGAKFVHR